VWGTSLVESSSLSESRSKIIPLTQPTIILRIVGNVLHAVEGFWPWFLGWFLLSSDNSVLSAWVIVYKPKNTMSQVALLALSVFLYCLTM
jgi:hypothetical protein